MRSRFIRIVPAVLLAALVSASAAAQELRRTPDGKPDLSGIWQVFSTANWGLLDHGAAKGVPAGQSVVEGNEIPYQPWAAAKRAENYENRATADPENSCFLPGVPRVTYLPFPFQIVQTPMQVTILYEYNHAIRYVYMDSPHLEGPLEFWMGDSRGRWEGDTLVIDTIHFNAETWFDKTGNFHSEALHVIERYTPMGPNHIDYEVSIEDPKVFTRPWKMRMPIYRRLETNVLLLEYVCYAYEGDNAIIRATQSR